MSANEWRTSALCAQTDPEIFFPEKGGSTKDAKAICARCPVVDECLDYAMSRPGLEGIWGGTTQRERQEMRAARGIELKGRPPANFEWSEVA